MIDDTYQLKLVERMSHKKRDDEEQNHRHEWMTNEEKNRRETLSRGCLMLQLPELHKQDRHKNVSMKNRIKVGTFKISIQKCGKWMANDYIN